jgi:hypothetical protein
MIAEDFQNALGSLTLLAGKRINRFAKSRQSKIFLFQWRSGPINPVQKRSNIDQVGAGLQKKRIDDFVSGDETSFSCVSHGFKGPGKPFSFLTQLACGHRFVHHSAVKKKLLYHLAHH